MISWVILLVMGVMKTVIVGEGRSGVADEGKCGGMWDLESDVDFLAGEGKTIKNINRTTNH